MEIKARHAVIVFQQVVGKGVHLAQRHLIAAFGTAHHFCSVACITRNAHGHDDTRHVFFHKVEPNGFCIGVEPHKLGDDGQLCGFGRIGWHEVIGLVGFFRFKAILKIYVIRHGVVFVQPLVESVSLLRFGREYGVAAELALAARLQDCAAA